MGSGAPGYPDQRVRQSQGPAEASTACCWERRQIFLANLESGSRPATILSHPPARFSAREQARLCSPCPTWILAAIYNPASQPPWWGRSGRKLAFHHVGCPGGPRHPSAQLDSQTISLAFSLLPRFWSSLPAAWTTPFNGRIFPVSRRLRLGGPCAVGSWSDCGLKALWFSSQASLPLSQRPRVLAVMRRSLRSAAHLLCVLKQVA